MKEIEMKGLHVYVAGPMKSVGGNWNMPLFDYVAKKLREKGCIVFSPAEHLREMHGDLQTVLDLNTELRAMARREALKDEILWIINDAEMVLLLPGWERSPGATAERAVALACKLPVHETDTVLLPVGDAKLDDPVASLAESK